VISSPPPQNHPSHQKFETKDSLWFFRCKLCAWTRCNSSPPSTYLYFDWTSSTSKPPAVVSPIQSSHFRVSAKIESRVLTPHTEKPVSKAFCFSVLRIQATHLRQLRSCEWTFFSPLTTQLLIPVSDHFHLQFEFNQTELWIISSAPLLELKFLTSL